MYGRKRGTRPETVWSPVLKTPTTALSTNDSMSVHNRTPQNGDAPAFHETAGPRALTDAQIDQMNHPAVEAAADEVRCYAVARVNGVIDYNDDALGFATGATVLYMSPGAEVAFERRYYVDAGEFEPIDAVSVTGVDDHPEPTAAMVANFAHVLEQHDDVAEVTE